MGLLNYTTQIDVEKTISEILPVLKEKILAREGKVVIRPDSGDPVKIICGYQIYKFEDNDWQHNPEAEGEAVKVGDKYYEITYAGGDEVNYYNEKNELSLPEIKGAIECMWDTFGGTITDKGYKLLDGHIGLIYGDSITIERCTAICERLKQKGFCSFNVVFGIGSYTYTYVTRDTHGFAVKATYGEVDGEARAIFKAPKTDDGTKNSAKGLIAVYRGDSKIQFGYVDGVTWHEVNNCEFKTVFKDGKLMNEQSLSEIRERLNPAVNKLQAEVLA